MGPKRALVACLSVAALGVLTAAGGAEARFFASPSGNVGCFISKSSGVRCDVKNRKWDPPPKPKWCELDWGNGLLVANHGRGKFVCAGDTVLNSEAPPLPRGQSIERGQYRCRSKRSGMRCVNERTKHGFKVSRHKAHRF